jgi:prepilin-type N-terminal cleavage/methylation domain-containing protein
MNRTASARRAQRGFTLVEVSVSLGICATLLSQAVPAMGKFRQERQLLAAAETLATDLRMARSEAARMSDSVFFRVSGKGAQACYVIHTGARNDCDCAGGQPVCKKSGSQVLKAEWLPASQPVRISSNAETLEFQHRQALVTQTGSIDLSLASGAGMRQVVAITGRVRSCYTSVPLAGIAKCK